MEPALDITLFGGLAAQLPSGEPVALPSRKGALLLAFLAMQPDGRATREQVIDVLWSDRGDTQARASLRQELTSLRKGLSMLDRSPMQVEGERLELHLDVVRVDAVEFERHCLSGSINDLEAAVALFRGELLSGAVVRDPAGEDWLRAQRGRLHERLAAALQALLTHHLANGSLGPATEAARRLAAEDPLREDVHRALIALLTASGRRAHALRHYEEYEALILRELAISPDARTVRLVQDIRAIPSEDASARARELLQAVAIEFGAEATPAPAAPLRLATPDHPAIAVLPLSSIGATNLDTFGDGLVDGITGALSRLRSIFVIARSSTLKYRHEPQDIPRIGSELGVRYLVLGSVQQEANRIRVRTELVDAGTGAMLWSDHHDGALEDAFDLQDRITERIVGAIAPNVRMAEIERARRKRPDSLAAYDHVMRALPHLWTMTREANATAMQMAYEAIRLDPNYALAYAYASWCHFWGFANNWTDSMEVARDEAYRCINEALRLDDNDPAVLSIAALSATAIRHDLDAASHYIEKALRLDPNYAWGWNRSGYIQIYRDRLDDALAHFERAARLSPFDPLTFNRHVGMALAHYCAGRYADAVRLAEQSRIERPGLPWAYRVLAAAQVELGNMDAARAAVAVLLGDTPTQTVSRVMDSMPFQRTDIRARFSAALVKAGMPTGRRKQGAIVTSR